MDVALRVLGIAAAVIAGFGLMFYMHWAEEQDGRLAGDPTNCIGQMEFERQVISARRQVRGTNADWAALAVEIVERDAAVSRRRICSGVDRAQPR